MTDYIANPKPTDAELQERLQISLKLYKLFLTMDTDQILDQYQEIYIRGAALIAIAKHGAVDMHVDERNPKRIDAKFVEEVKGVMRRESNLIG